jgi:spore coat polysaccharide biosynthesis protein SpsF (cytidylyltransferase family)
MKITAVIQARMNSSRFPQKITQKIQDKNLLEHVIDNAIFLDFFDEIIVATASNEDNDFVKQTCFERKIKFFSGHPDNLFQRFLESTTHLLPDDSFARITADNPIIFKKTCERILQEHISENNDYTSVEGLSHCGIEMIKVSSFRALDSIQKDDYEIEHATPYFRKPNSIFKAKQIPYDLLGLEKKIDDKLTIDFPRDLDLIKKIAEKTDICNAKKENVYSAFREIDIV